MSTTRGKKVIVWHLVTIFTKPPIANLSRQGPYAKKFFKESILDRDLMQSKNSFTKQSILDRDLMVSQISFTKHSISRQGSYANYSFTKQSIFRQGSYAK